MFHPSLSNFVNFFNRYVTVYRGITGYFKSMVNTPFRKGKMKRYMYWSRSREHSSFLCCHEFNTLSRKQYVKLYFWFTIKNKIWLTFKQKSLTFQRFNHCKTIVQDIYEVTVVKVRKLRKTISPVNTHLLVILKHRMLQIWKIPLLILYKNGECRVFDTKIFCTSKL